MEYSPMMKQYMETKEKYPGEILFFRLGDFYEMFFEDAERVSRELDLVLTKRACGNGDFAPMCGVPFHSAEGYIARLLEKGYKVAICEQMEDPKAAKGIVKRDIVRVVTPGTVVESSMLDESRNNYICSLVYRPGAVGIAMGDVSTGQLYAAQLNLPHKAQLLGAVTNRLGRYAPREILLDPEAAAWEELTRFIRERSGGAGEKAPPALYENQERAEKAVVSLLGNRTLPELGLTGKPLAVLALFAFFSYLEHNKMSGRERMNRLELMEDGAFMALSLMDQRNLELTETMRGKERRGSLLWVLDKTRTAMGKRLIRQWVAQPLLSPAQITLRQNAVEELVQNPPFLDDLTEKLGGIHDLERIMTRVVYGSANARELKAVGEALKRLPGIKAVLKEAQATLLQTLDREIDPLEDVPALLDKALVDEPPLSIRDGGTIRPGFEPELDEVRRDRDGGRELLAALEARERERTGIPKLKTGYNRVFGYYIEVSNSYKNMAPADYIRKQTLSNGERYVTQELKELEARILGAQDRALELESRAFEYLRRYLARALPYIQAAAGAIAVLDVLCSFAAVSAARDYTRPTVNLSGKIYLKDSRHPVVEALLRDRPFVPNDVDMDMGDNRVQILTGPNMAGKSTYMRQIAITAILAQIGCFVPASKAEIGIVDGIYTRVGASDDLSAGQSTFMLEMAEVAQILKSAGKNSLVVFDEIGRGTSTFDGMSIARAVLEYVHDTKQVGAKTLFATHYHELTAMADELPGVKNFNVAVKKRGDDITFLRRIIPGGADDSFGIEVAKLAGVPDKVLGRAKEVLAQLEKGSLPQAGRQPGLPPKEEPVQLTMDSPESQVITRLQAIDVNALTPIECMNILFELRKMLR